MKRRDFVRTAAGLLVPAGMASAAPLSIMGGPGRLHRASSGGSAPVNTAPPAVTGSPTIGSTLSCSTGTWTNDPTSYSYQWLRDGNAIPGATSATYQLQEADEGEMISCAVTATNSAGSAAEESNEVGPVEEAAPAGEGDIYSQDFAEGSVSGLSRWGDPQPATVVDATSPSGYSLRYLWQSGYENYNGAFYTLSASPARKHLYVRIRMKKGAGASISGIQKQIRFRGFSGSNDDIPVGTLNTQWNLWNWGGDVGANFFSEEDDLYGPVRSVDEWVWLEAFVDYRTAGRMIAQVWCDGEMVIDCNTTNSGNFSSATQNPDFRISGVMFLGTYNSPADSRYDWISRIDVGTAFIGVP